MGFWEVIITVTDLDAAIAFYTDACRFRLVRTVDVDDVRVAELDAQGQRVTLVPGAAPGIQLVLPSGNARSEQRRLARNGRAAEVKAPVQAPGGTWVSFTDPSGNRLAYWQQHDA